MDAKAGAFTYVVPKYRIWQKRASLDGHEAAALVERSSA
jgi:hypothetical protein